MATISNYYVYLYLREDLTPYYVGKGKGKRAFVKQRVTSPPVDTNLIHIVACNLLESDAFLLEIKLIAEYGRKDIGTGILHNRTNGGDGPSGRIMSAEQKLIVSSTHKGKIVSDATKQKLSIARKNRITLESTRRKSSIARVGSKNHFFGKKHTEETKAKMRGLRGQRTPTLVEGK